MNLVNSKYDKAHDGKGIYSNHSNDIVLASTMYFLHCNYESLIFFSPYIIQSWFLIYKLKKNNFFSPLENISKSKALESQA